MLAFLHHSLLQWIQENNDWNGSKIKKKWKKNSTKEERVRVRVRRKHTLFKNSTTNEEETLVITAMFHMLSVCVYLNHVFGSLHCWHFIQISAWFACQRESNEHLLVDFHFHCRLSRRRWERARNKVISIYVYMYRRSIETRRDDKTRPTKKNWGNRGKKVIRMLVKVATDCDKEEEEEEVQLHKKETLNWSIEIKQRQRKEIDLVM